MALKKEITQQIRDLLRQNPGGLSITAIVRQIPINRNTAGRYLENLMVSGQVEMRHFGMAKIYSLAQRVPLSAMLSISSELIMLLDRSRRVIYANEPMLDFLDVTQRGLYGKTIEFTPLQAVFDEAFDDLKRQINGGIGGREWSGEIPARNGTIIFSCRVAPAVFEEGQRGVSVLLENITDRKQAEKALRESEETLRSIADNTPDTILLTNLEGEILFINHTFTIPPEEIPSRSVFDFIPKKYHAQARASFERVIKTGKAAVYQSDHRFPDGENRYFESTVGPVFHDRNVVALVINSRDITERVLAEQDLRESEDRYRTLIEVSPDAIFLHQDGQVIYMNPAARELLEIPALPASLSSILDRIPEDIRKNIRDNIRRDLDGDLTPRLEFPFLKRDGSLIILDGRGVRTIVDGRPAIQVTLRDITEQKKAEDAIRESEEKYRHLVEQSLQGLTILQNGRPVFANPAMLEISGYSLEEYLAFGADEMLATVHPMDREKIRKVNEDLQAGKNIPAENEFRIFRKDGSIRWVLTHGSLITYNGAPAIQIAYLDITERKQAEDAIRESQRRLVASQHIARLGDVTWDLTTGKVSWSEGMYNLLGFDRSEKIDPSRVYTENHHPDDKERVNAWLNACLTASGDRVPPLEYRIIRKDGEVLFVHAEGEIQRIDGKPVRVMVTVQDITERKKSEDTLLRSRQKLGEALDIGRMASWEFDAVKGVFFFDDRFYALYGTTTEREGTSEMSAETYAREFFHPDDRYLMDQTLMQVRSTTDPDFLAQVEHRIIRRDGVVRHILVRIRVILDAEGRVIRTYGTNQDITERKMVEDALRKSRQQLEDAMDMASLVTWEYDPESRLFLLNDRFFGLFGTTTEREGRSTMPVEVFVREFVHPDDMHLVVSETEKALKSTGPVYTAQREVRMIRRDGVVRNILALIRIMRDPAGRTVTVQGTLQDITDRKCAEDALRKSRQQLEDAMGMANLYTWEYDPATDAFLFNDHLFTLFGTTLAQECTYSMKSDTFLRTFVHPEDRNAIIAAVENAMKSADPRYSGRKEARIIRRDGGIRNVITLIRVQRDTGKDTILVWGTLQDITDQKRAEEAIRESEATARALINAPTDRIILTDKYGKILDLNEAAAQSLGKKRDEIIGQPPSAVLSPASATARMPRMMDVVATGKAARFIDEREGIWFDNVIYPVFNPQGEVARLAIVARDITDQKQTEATLRKSESRYRTLAEASQDIIFLIGRDDTVEYVNSSAAAILGIPADRIIGRSRSSFFSGELGERQAQALHRVFATGIAGRDEGPMEVAGSMHWFDHHLMPIMGPDGDVTAVLGVSRDITDRKQAEEALAESENRFHSLAELLPQNVWECAVDGRLTFANRHSFEMYKYAPEDLRTGLYIAQMIHPDDRARVMDDFIEALMHPPEDFPPHHEYTAVRSDGSTFPVLMYHAPIVSNNRIVGMRGIGIDLTGRREMEEALRETVRSYRLLAENSVDMIYRILPDGTCAYMSPAVRSSLGYEPEEFIGHHGSEFLHPEDIPHIIGVMEAFENNGADTGTDRFRMRHKDGSYIWFDATIRATRDEKTGAIREFTLVSRYAGKSDDPYKT